MDNADKSLKVIDAQVRLGALARGALLQQQTLIAQQQAQIPPLEKALAQTRHQLAVLAGRLPGDDGLPTFDIDSLTLPRELPVQRAGRRWCASARTCARARRSCTRPARRSAWPRRRCIRRSR